MAEYLIQEETLTNIANAIRTKTGKSEDIIVSNMADEINDIDEPVDAHNEDETAHPYILGELTAIRTEHTTAIEALETVATNKSDKGHTHAIADVIDFPTSMPASDVPSWAKETSKPSYTASEVGADASGTASSLVSSHNADTSAHSDIRTAVSNAQSKADSAYALATESGSGVQMVTGSYTGTGQYGSSNKNTLTFPFTPKVVIVHKQDSSIGGIAWLYGVSESRSKYDEAVVLTWSGNTVSWYYYDSSSTSLTGSTKAAYQLNSSGKTYMYIAIG